MVIHKGNMTDGNKDIRFEIDCDKFTKGDEDDNDMEHCLVKFRFPMPDSELMLDNHWKSCTCDEYLAGVKSFLQKSRGRSQRMVQWRCCYANKKVMNLSSCYYTGLRYLWSPWQTELKTNTWKWPRYSIHSLTVSENYVNAKVCQWLIKGRDIRSEDAKHWPNKCEGVKKISAKDIYDKIKEWAQGKCTIPTGMAPFGWPESSNSEATEKEIVHKEDRLYGKQQHMCRDGNYLYGLYKYPRIGPRGKDYIFLTKCHELTYSVCYCVWKLNCTKPEDRLNNPETNTTYYVAGWRSKWNEQLRRRDVEVLCCKSNGLQMRYCNVTKNFTDRDTRLVINRPRHGFFSFQDPQVMDGEIIRDIDQWHINGSLILRFNICRINGSDGFCEEPCYSCRDLPGSSCNIPQITTTTTTSTTTTKTTTTAAEPKFDFAFLLDESGSLKQEGFDTEIQFLTEFTGQFTIDPGITQTSMLTFSDTAVVEWDFESFPDQTTQGVVGRINALNWAAGRTDITGSLEDAIPIFQNMARPDVNQVVILLTDGRHNQTPNPPSVPAATLRGMGVQIFAIAIGDKVNLAELEAITGDPAKVYETDFANLVANVATIKQLIIANAIVR